jgi:hypothetical protein
MEPERHTGDELYLFPHWQVPGHPGYGLRRLPKLVNTCHPLVASRRNRHGQLPYGCTWSTDRWIYWCSAHRRHQCGTHPWHLSISVIYLPARWIGLRACESAGGRGSYHLTKQVAPGSGGARKAAASTSASGNSCLITIRTLRVSTISSGYSPSMVRPTQPSGPAKPMWISRARTPMAVIIVPRRACTTPPVVL